MVSASEPHPFITGGVLTSGPLNKSLIDAMIIVPAGDDKAMALAVLLTNSHSCWPQLKLRWRLISEERTVVRLPT